MDGHHKHYPVLALWLVWRAGAPVRQGTTRRSSRLANHAPIEPRSRHALRPFLLEEIDVGLYGRSLGTQPCLDLDIVRVRLFEGTASLLRRERLRAYSVCATWSMKLDLPVEDHSGLLPRTLTPEAAREILAEPAILGPYRGVRDAV